MKCKITGRQYSEEARYAEWDSEKEFPEFDKVAEQEWEIEVDSLEKAETWLANNHPDKYMGSNISCENGDFSAQAVPCNYYGKGNFETQSARIAWVRRRFRKVWAPEEIKSLIQTNDTVLYRALKRLYAEQTDDEQFREHTVERNGRGFNKVDADFLTSVSKFLNSRGFLTEKQKVATRRKLIKYNAQLTRLANEGRC